MSERKIFIEAIERSDPAERSAYLDGACHGNSSLRQRIERLLRSYEGASEFLESPPRRSLP